MLYKFKSKATADLIMLGPDAQRLLRIMGFEGDSQGILTVDRITAAVAALQEAIMQDEARIAAIRADRLASQESQDVSEQAVIEGVSLKRRAQPMLEMLGRSLKEQVDVLWGV